MTRILPWVNRGTTSMQSKRASTSVNPRPKRQRLIEFSSDVDDAGIDELSTLARSKARVQRTSSSPARPLEPPKESFMKEGMNRDDGFRMVEDEFLDTAKQFTQHLYAATYERMKKASKSRNAEAIGSISRPVTLRMPEETRRKVESVTRSKTQAHVVRGLLGKEEMISKSDDEFDGDQAPWVGTALHGLMDSPRKKIASLVKVGGVQADTRAAAGFQRSHSSRSGQSSRVSMQKTANRTAPRYMRAVSEELKSSHDEDDGEDLDALIRKPKLWTPPKVASTAILTLSTTRGKDVVTQSKVNRSEKSPKHVSESSITWATEIPTGSNAKQVAIDSRARVARRLEHARAQKTKTAEKEIRKKNLNDIPTFL